MGRDLMTRMSAATTGGEQVSPYGRDGSPHLYFGSAGVVTHMVEAVSRWRSM